MDIPNPNILDLKYKYLQLLELRLNDRETRSEFLSAVPPEFFDLVRNILLKIPSTANLDSNDIIITMRNGARARLTLDTQINASRWLLFHLGNQGARISDFIYWLQLANLQNVLLDLEVDVPLQIITQPPGRVEVQEGGRLAVYCEASSFPHPEFQWFKDETELLLQQDPELVIPSVNLQDSGRYFCIISKRSPKGDTSTLHTNFVEVIVSPAGETKLKKPNAVNQYFAESKIAFLIANDSYETYKSLETPATDVSDLAELLKKMYFKVFAFKNLNKQDMDKVLSVFYCMIKENSYALFFFAGHGFENNGQTYLQPVDCSESYEQNESICTEKIVQNLQNRRPALNVLLIDACRKPVPNWKGPWKKYKTHMEGNTIYGYSTSFLSNAYECEERNSFFVKHLKKYIEEDKSIQEVLMHVLGAFKEENLGSCQYPVIKHSLCDFRKLNDPLRNPSILHFNISSNNDIRSEEIECPKLKCKFIIENKNLAVFFNGVWVDVFIELEETADLSSLDFIKISLEFNLPNKQITPTATDEGVWLKDLTLRLGTKNLLLSKEVIGIQHLRNEELDAKLMVITYTSNTSRVSECNIPLNIGSSWTDFELISNESVISESY